MTFRVRSTCISSFNVSMPFISGISTSRMIKSGRSPSLTLAMHLLSGADRLHVVAVHFQQRLQILADARLIIHDQNFFFHGH